MHFAVSRLLQRGFPLPPHHPQRKLEELLNDIDKILETVDYIHLFTLTGGEPFLFNDLDQIILRLADSTKIRHIEILTNGTVIPNQKVLNAIKNNSVFVCISGYPREVVKNPTAFINKLKDNHINYVYREYKYFCQMGEIKHYERTPSELMKQSQRCGQKNCLTLFNGTFYICARSAHVIGLGKTPINPSDYVDLQTSLVAP
jgi:hypothetical protein